MKYFALLGVLALAVACGGNDKPGFVGGDGGSPASGGSAGHAGRSGGSSGHGGSSGTDATGDAGEAGASDANPLAPTVQITSPVAVADPNDGVVLTNPTVLVVCSVKESTASGAAPVQTPSVTIQVFGADGKQIGADGNVKATDNNDEYSASFVLTDVPNGAISFKCAATDTASPAHAAADVVSTFLDKGPTVALVSPKPNSAHPLQALSFSFSALPAPLSSTDKSATVSSVSLKVNGITIDAAATAEVTGQPGIYTLPIDLTDTSIFSPLPSGAVPVRITAKNARGVTNTQDYTFSVDSTGPVITILSPALNSFVGGNVTIEFTVDDAPAGVDPSTVAVKINGQSTVFDPKNMWSQTGNKFDYTFSTVNYLSQIQLAVNVVASDLAGNPSPGASTIFYLDNVPPIIDMDPPALQERQLFDATQYECSEPFDPLGDSPADKAVIQSVSVFRALLWDVGNSADGQNLFYFSDIEPKSVRLYFQSDVTKPLVENEKTVSGGVCNVIADDTLPFVSLVPVSPDLSTSAYYDAAAPQIAGCDIKGNATKKPAKACNGLSDLSRVIQHDLASATPAIPAVYAVASDASQCTGGQFDITTIVHQDGWVCAAVFAKDKTGNPMASAPLRLCLDSKAIAGSPDCATMSVPAPDCTKDCTPSVGFKQNLITKPH